MAMEFELEAKLVVSVSEWRGEDSTGPNRSILSSLVSTATLEMDKQQQRQWDELNLDCLLNVFARLGMEELLYDVPFVCKSWHRASHNPSCWQSLDFPDIDHSAIDKDDYSDDSSEEDEPKPREPNSFYDKFVHVYPIESSRFSISGIVKVVLKRSNGLATSLGLPRNCVPQVLTSVSDVIPGLKFLSLWCDYKLTMQYKLALRELFTKCTNLETLSLESSSRNFRHQKLNSFLILTHLRCKSVVDLRVLNSQMCKHDTFAISSKLPKLKYLSFRKCDMDRDGIISLLQRCTEMVDIFKEMASAF
ncbi:hypothetical protein ACLB2K_057169 [Fragaria x ananassa]